MDTPKKDGLASDNLYQIPTCTICLAQLTQDLTSLACGHCFHFLCITQHFQYRGTCPNCQKRACLKETRTLHFPLVLNTKTSAHLRTLLASLTTVQRKQMEEILKEFKLESQKAQKLRSQNAQNEIQLKSKTALLQAMKEDMSRKKKDIQVLRKQNLQMGQQRDNLRMLLNESERSEAFLRSKMDKLQLQLKDYEQVKRYKKIMNENSEELLRLKAEMEHNQIPPVEMAKQFFQICQMGKLEEGKYRQKIKDVQQKLDFHQHEIDQLKQCNSKVQKDFQRLHQRLAAQRKKSEELQAKYKRLKEKSMDNEDKDKEDSNAISNGSRKMLKNESKLNKTLKQSTLEENLQALGENSIRKPTFSTSAKFGGFAFRKKDDALKLFK